MKRFVTLSMDSKLKTFEYKEPPQKVGPYVVDDSNFVPVSEAIKQLNKVAPLTDEEIKAAYDFPDGKDNGMSIPINRKNNIALDVAEVSSSIMAKTEELSNKIAEEKNKAQRKADFEKRLSAIKTDSPTPSGN